MGQRHKMEKEDRAIAETGFTPAQVMDFREIFLMEDTEGKDVLSFQNVKVLLHRISPLSAKLVQELGDSWQKIVESEKDRWCIDFPDFLLLMRHLIDINFANIASLVLPGSEQS